MRSKWSTPKGTTLYIQDLKGKEYLQVSERLVWFREEKPLWQIRTDFLRIEQDFAIAKCEIFTENGQLVATAHKREDKAHFADFMEKAETGALGRALAYIGYGTQFCADELDEGKRVVDSPQAPKADRTVNATAPRMSAVARAEAPSCCGDTMMSSKFEKDTWYCKKCKTSQAMRGAV